MEITGGADLLAINLKTGDQYHIESSVTIKKIGALSKSISLIFSIRSSVVYLQNVQEIKLTRLKARHIV